MTWPIRVQEIVDALATGPDAAYTAEDEKRRAITRKIAEQCRFEFGTNWGTKRAAAGRPPSTDVICTFNPFVGWDWSVPSGIAQFPESIDLMGQVFVPVEAINHLSGYGTSPEESSPPSPEILLLDDLYASLKSLFEIVSDLTAQLKRNEIEFQLTREVIKMIAAQQNPDYTGTVIRWPVTLHPKPKEVR